MQAVGLRGLGRWHGLGLNRDASPVADNPVIVRGRQLDDEKKLGESELPYIRCPLCGSSPRKEDKWFLHLRIRGSTTGIA